jgi:signal transduction histidine kinase
MYTLVLPSLSQAGLLPESFLIEGPFGIGMLKPHQLFHIDVAALGFDQYVHAVFWSMLANVGCYIGISLFSGQTAREHTQATLFVDVYKHSAEIGSSFWRGTASIPALESLLGRFLGNQRAKEVFLEYAIEHNMDGQGILTADAGLVDYVEKLLAGTLGSASARVMVASVVKEEPLSIEDVMDILHETRKVIIHSRELEKATAELKLANERLQELDTLKNEFISTVTHELRTPLTSVRAVAEVLYYNSDLELDQRTKFSKIIIDESERLSRLITDILDFQKIESGRIEWNLRVIDFNQVVKDSVEATHQLILKRRIRLDVNMPDHTSLIRGDYDRLMQVMLNLISNAVKFCDESNGIITITVAKENSQLVVSVADNGVGIHPKNHKLIFEEFRQIVDAAKGRPSGTGLGLSITKRIINYHKGNINVQSNLGMGSKFIFTLPLLPEMGEGLA